MFLSCFGWIRLQEVVWFFGFISHSHICIHSFTHFNPISRLIFSLSYPHIHHGTFICIDSDFIMDTSYIRISYIM